MKDVIEKETKTKEVDNIFKTQLAEENWRSKYQYKGETPYETQKRLAKALASVEKDPEYWYPIFLDTLVKYDENGNPDGLKCTPGGRITANAGTEFAGASMFNCYINGPVKNATINYDRIIPKLGIKIPVEYKTPDTGDDLKNIILTLLEQACTLGSEGGWGINLSFIRPRGSVVKGIGVQHPGIIKFAEVFDKMSEVIVSGNNDGYKAPLKDLMSNEEIIDLKSKYKGSMKAMSRKGAMMLVLDISHPDIEEFIISKQQGGKLTKFNISVMVTDEFLKAVEEDGDFNLSFEGVVRKKVKARELYDLIMKSTYNRAEPGVLYYDNMQKNNPISYLGPINATNPCGEIGGNPIITTVCLLGSINLTQYINKERQFDFKTYTKDIGIFARMLDNVNDLQERDLPPYLWAIKNVRQYGMGLNGLGSALYMLGIPYNSKEAIDIVTKFNRIKMNECLRTSALLADEKGVAPAFSTEYYNTNYWTNFLDGKIDDDVKELILKYGVRNLKQGTNAPLGNSSVISNMMSNGVEPVFMHNYERTYIAPAWPEGLTTENVREYLEEVKIADVTCWKGEYANKIYYFEPHNRGLCIIEKVYDYGYKWVLDNFPQEITSNEPYLITSTELSVEEHVAIQEVFQSYVDQSISKTANIPNDYPYEKFKSLYLEAWKKGLNGFTTYRDGTMESVLTKITDNEEIEREIIKDVILPNKFINGPCEVIVREGIKFYIHFSYLEEDSKMKFPITMWIQTNHKYNGEAVYVNRAIKSLMTLLEKYGIEQEQIEKFLEKSKDNTPNIKLAKAVSMCLRHNLPILSIVLSLENIDGDNVSSLLTAVRKFLSSHIKDGAKITNRSCSNCSQGNLIFESGCSKCLDCGSSNCG